MLILDDVVRRADSGCRERSASLIADCEQVLMITAAVPGDVPAVLSGLGTTYRVTLGKVLRDDETKKAQDDHGGDEVATGATAAPRRRRGGRAAGCWVPRCEATADGRQTLRQPCGGERDTVGGVGAGTAGCCPGVPSRPGSSGRCADETRVRLRTALSARPVKDGTRRYSGTRWTGCCSIADGTSTWAIGSVMGQVAGDRGH